MVATDPSRYLPIAFGRGLIVSFSCFTKKGSIILKEDSKSIITFLSCYGGGSRAVTGKEVLFNSNTQTSTVTRILSDRSRLFRSFNCLKSIEAII